MIRQRSEPRPDWRARCDAVGFDFYETIDEYPYWNESVCYKFTAAEIDRLQNATEVLHQLALKAVDHVVSTGSFSKVGIPAQYGEVVADSWRRQHSSLYGRLDLAYDGTGEPRLLEYNADTPTSLLEAAVVQWHWLNETHAGADQFNSLHEKLIARWQATQGSDLYHFACDLESYEDVGTVRYLIDTACQAGLPASRLIALGDIGVQAGRKTFVDRDGRAIEDCFKLYPWEWMFADEFGLQVAAHTTRFIEPAWKAILSSKGILALLWELFPDHPNLLPAYLSEAPLAGGAYVRKPMHSREGANIKIVGVGPEAESGGPYSAEPSVYQKYAPLFTADGMTAVIGSWIVGNEPAGIGIREDSSLITGNVSQFVPHYFE